MKYMGLTEYELDNLKTKSYSIKRKQLSDQVMDAIANFIVDKDIGYGDLLPSELDMAQLFGVSRNTIRETIKALKTLGIVESSQNKGIIFRGFNVGQVEAFMPFVIMDKETYRSSVKARLWYEQSIIPIVMQHATEIYLIKMREIIDRSHHDLAEGLEHFLDTDRRFHNQIRNCVPNQAIRDVGKIINEFFYHCPLPTYESIKKNEARIINDHYNIVDFIRSKDVEGMSSMLEKHLNRDIDTLVYADPRYVRKIKV